MVVAVVEAERMWAIAMGDAIGQELGARKQRWLADETGMDAATISRIIRGQQLPTLDQLDRIARVLDTTRRILLERAGYIETSGEIDLSSLTPEGRDAVLGAYEGALEGLRRRRNDPANGVNNGL